MFGLRTKLPIEEDGLWVDDDFLRLSLMLGTYRMLNFNVVQPTDECLR